MQSVSIKVECYGELQELCGGAQLQLELTADEPTVENLIAELACRYPAAQPLLARSVCAVGDSIVDRAKPLQAGAEIALIPPVSGG